MREEYIEKIGEVQVLNKVHPVYADGDSLAAMERIDASPEMIIDSLLGFGVLEIARMMQENRDNMIETRYGVLAFAFYPDKIILISLATLTFEIKESGEVEKYSY